VTGFVFQPEVIIMSTEQIPPAAMAHGVLLQMQEFVHKKWPSVGPVWICATAASPSDDDLDEGKTALVTTFQILFKLGNQSVTLTVHPKDLDTVGVECIGLAYQRLMGR